MYGVTMDELAQANGLDNPNAISVGQALVIP
jgi:LysM repeat protein